MASGFPLHDLGVNLVVTGAVALTVMVITFAIALLRGKHSVVDVTWGLGFAAVALTTYCLSIGSGDAARRLLVAALTPVWGLRLAAHIAARNWGHGEDPRYDKLLDRHPGNRKIGAFIHVYLTQGIVLWIVSLPVQVASYESEPLNWISVLGIAIWFVGFSCESIGDWQLSRFKARRANGAPMGQVMDTGLWRYTRHPNYFGDACIWWGIFLLAGGHWVGLLTAFSPLLMNYLLVKKTGKRMLEDQLSQSRPGYQDYIKRTSGFFPLPPKKGEAR